MKEHIHVKGIEILADRRLDYWKSENYFEEYGWLFTAGKSDMSNTNIKYDSRCNWCYIGASHTEDAHAKKISE